MNENYGRVLISSIWKKVDNPSKGIKAVRIPIRTEEEYLDYFNKMNVQQGGYCEIVGLNEFKVKPYFDYDDKSENVPIDIENQIEKELLKVCPTEVFICGREEREVEGLRGQTFKKFSRRFYVKAQISYFNIPIIFKEVFDKFPCLDKSVYDYSRVMMAPLSNRKKNEIVPELKTIKGTIFDNCASYIKEDYLDLDLKVIKVETKVDCEDRDEDIIDEDEDNDDKYLKLQKIINLMTEKRAADFDSWIKVCWAILNIGKKENINVKKIERLIHKFSSKSNSNYNEDKVDEWLIKNPIENLREVGYGWNYLYQTCLKEDAPEYHKKLTQSYFNVKKEFEKTHCKILHPPMVIYSSSNNNLFQPIHLCEKSYRHLQCSVKEVNKKGEVIYKNKRFIEKWLDDPQIRIYEKFSFNPPPIKTPDNEFNAWLNFEITKTPYITNDIIIERFLDYAKNLFDNEEVVLFLIAYFANRLQRPADRNCVCIVIYGEEGDGKNRFLDIFKGIFGKKYFIELESAKQLFGNHSTVENEKLFICINEAKGKDNYENADILKARITTPTLIINPKGIQEFQVDNYCDYIMTTNNYNVINIHDKSRRFAIFETTSFYSKNTEFFNSFSEEIVDNNKALRVIYEYLMNFDVNEVIKSGNFQNHIPITETKLGLIKYNRDKIEVFLRDLVNDIRFITDDETEERKFKNLELFNEWLRWVDNHKIDIKYNSISFGCRFGNLIKKNAYGKFIRRDANKNTFILFFGLKEHFETDQ